MSSTVNHEMLTPLRCITSMIDLLRKKKFSDASIKNNLNIVADTTQIVLSQIKNNLDNNLLETEHFMLKLERLRLIKDVIYPTVSVFKG